MHIAAVVVVMYIHMCSCNDCGHTAGCVGRVSVGFCMCDHIIGSFLQSQTSSGPDVYVNATNFMIMYNTLLLLQHQILIHTQLSI